MATHVRSPQEREELAAGHKVHDHVQICGVLECAPEIDDERMLHRLEHHLFVAGVRLLLHAHDLFLAQHLDGVEPQVVFASHYVWWISITPWPWNAYVVRTIRDDS